MPGDNFVEINAGWESFRGGKCTNSHHGFARRPVNQSKVVLCDDVSFIVKRWKNTHSSLKSVFTIRLPDELYFQPSLAFWGKRFIIFKLARLGSAHHGYHPIQT